MKSFFALIVGQGLAGTALAWKLHQRGHAFLIVDQNLENTCSKVAAGLVTPVTGKRGVTTWSWETAWPRAHEHYAYVERLTEYRFWFRRASLRLYASEAERLMLEQRFAAKPCHLRAEYVESDRGRDQDIYENGWGGFVMPCSAQLNTRGYLRASRDFFGKQNFQAMILDPRCDLESRVDGIVIPKLGVVVEHVVFAQGFTGQENTWFPQLPLVPSQGDILSLDIPGYDEDRAIHRGLWLTRQRDVTPLVGATEHDQTRHRYLVGSTTRWHHLDGQPDEAGRVEIEQRLREWFKLPYRVVDHVAGVRPSSYAQRPLLGSSRLDQRIWVFNGLGAKGTLYSPWMAEILMAAMTQQAPIPKELDWTLR